MNGKLLCLSTGLAALLTGTAIAADEVEYSTAVGKDYPQNVYWGDTHLHSRNSADAYSVGNMNLTQADAYRFAQGQELVAHNGMKVKLRRPLDFLVVSDHAEYLGGFYRFNVGDPLVVDTETGRRWTEIFSNPETAGSWLSWFGGSMSDPENYPAFPERTRKLIWQEVAQTADDYNDPGQFTALIGYEWTISIAGNNLHRVVVYKDAADKVGQLPPFSGQDSNDPRELWKALARYEAATGGEVMAIAHNGNLSNGMMFPSKSVDGKPIDRAYAELRSRWEIIYEVSQVKGDGESHPTLSPDDEFADFENWDWDNIGRSQAKEDWMLKHEYARGALKLGLKYESELGVNPFKIGLIASSDNHTSLAASAEDNFFGKFPESEPGPARLKNTMIDRLWDNWRIVASGYAAVWARENTREALFEAMKRREVYATTGSRIAVRFFGGFGYEEGDLNEPAWLDIAYGKGVPMGGDLTAAGEKAPSFMVSASKDPDGANLDRAQIIKGWLDAEGNLQEKVYDVALSDGRVVNPETGKAPPVGSTVDVADASYTNSIGAATLSAQWTDPDFDAAERAFYYVRVIEIPVPRWTAYDAKFFKLDLPDEIPMVIQDRAYTSPIWYTP